MENNMISLEKEQLLRKYANHQITWSELRECGFEDYIQVLGGLGELGLRAPTARMIGPNVAARQRGIAIIRASLKEQSIIKEQVT
jgi:hypothetical protein